MHWKKHICPKCGGKVELRYVSKIVNSKSPEAKNYDFSVGDTFFVGDVEFRTRYCYCPNCLLNVSFQKMKKINRKVMLSYLQASLWGREMLKILVQSQALKKVPKNSGQMPWKFSGDAC